MAKVADYGHLTGGRLSHHRLVGRRQVCRVQRPRAVDGHPINGTEGRMGKVQVQASVRGERAECVSNTHHYTDNNNSILREKRRKSLWAIKQNKKKASE